MSKYCYEITGKYKDSLKMKKEDFVIHDGNLVGLISYTNGRLELNLNYGNDTHYPCEIKKSGDLIITIPIKEYLYMSDYIYIPLVFEAEEYEQFIEIIYIDRALLDNIHQINKQDIYNLLMMHFKLKFGIWEMLSFKDIIDNIIACSVESSKVIACIQSSLSSPTVNIKRLDENNLINITVYIDLSGKLYEWTSIVKIDEKYYFAFIDKYAIEIS